MSDPINPNYKPGVGRLVTDRFDFQKHVEGQTLRHTAPSIDLFPTVVINGNTTTTVQDALYQLSVALNPPVIQDATTFQKGIIQLTGDISGAATNVRVVALRGYPVNTNAPATNDVLTWNGTNWGPSPNLSPFTATGDLSGNNIIQQVINISGNGSFVTMTCNELLIEDVVANPTITQRGINGVSGQNLSITAQGVSGTGVNGGSIIITGGEGGSGTSDLDGGVSLRLGSNTPANMVQALHLQQFPQVRRITALNANTANFATSMGTSTGDLVTFIGNAASTPVNPPVGGSILYSSDGKMHVRQADNTDVTIGQDTTPFIWGTVANDSIGGGDGQVYRDRYVVTSGGASGATYFFPIAVPDHCAVYFDVKIIGKQDTPVARAAWFHMSAGFCRETTLFEMDVRDNNIDGYMPVPPYVEHNRLTSGAFNLWDTQPTISTSGNFLTVITGGKTATNITWLIIAEMIICPSYSAP